MEHQPAPLATQAALEALAARFRLASTCLIVARPDMRIAYHDAQAGAFFTAEVLPQLTRDGSASSVLYAAGMNVSAASSVSTCEPMPGVVAALMPLVEKRLMSGVLMLVGRSTTEPAADVKSAMSAESLRAWSELSAYTPESIMRLGRLLLTTLRDQVRLSAQDHELAELSGQLSNTYEELSLIYQISGGMRVNRRPDSFFRQACLDAIPVMDVRGIGVALVHATELSVPPVLYGVPEVSPQEGAKLAHQLLQILSRTKSTLLVNDVAADPRFAWMSGKVRRLLATPIERGDEVLGSLVAVDKLHDDFDSADSKLLHSIASESGIYLENAVLFEDVHGLMMGLMHSLTSAVDAKDTYTCGHSVRVATVSKLIATEARLDEALIERVYMAGLLHDVGKIGVPESILQKPGRLTDDEFEQMKRHPTIGAHILADVKQVEDLIPGVLHHHERFDGRGYPNKLAGRDIPLMGRIICLADCFDAMTSTRTYRRAMPLEVALADIRRCSGTQFDPALTEAFLQLPVPRLIEALRPTESSLRLPTHGELRSGEKAA